MFWKKVQQEVIEEEKIDIKEALNYMEELSLKMDKEIFRSLMVVELNGGKPEVIKRDLVNMKLNLEELQNTINEVRSGLYE